MKSNQKMVVKLTNEISLTIYHKTAMGNLTDLWHDVARIYRSRTPGLANWLKSDRTQRFIKKTSELTGLPSDQLVHVTGRGRSAYTSAHLNVIIFAMEHIAPEINAIVINEFVHRRILDWRDESGDDFIELNAMMSAKALEVLGKPAHRGHYIQVARALKERIDPPSGDWNLATASQLAERDRIESLLTNFLKHGFVRDWEHLKELVETA